jgi:hypothetical protein
VTQAIQILIIAVLIVTFFAVGRLYFVLGNVRQTLANLETTRTEISSTLKRLETVAETTQKVLDEEVAPTLKVARETLVNVEITTRALAETTQAIRRLTGKAEGVANAQQLLKVGGPILKQVAQRSAGVFGGFFSGIGAGVRAILGRRKPVREPPTETAEAVVEQRALPAPEAENKELPSTRGRSKTIASGSKKR